MTRPLLGGLVRAPAWKVWVGASLRQPDRTLGEAGCTAALPMEPEAGMRHELAAVGLRTRLTRIGLWFACDGPHEP